MLSIILLPAVNLYKKYLYLTFKLKYLCIGLALELRVCVCPVSFSLFLPFPLPLLLLTSSSPSRQLWHGFFSLTLSLLLLSIPSYPSRPPLASTTSHLLGLTRECCGEGAPSRGSSTCPRLPGCSKKSTTTHLFPAFN